MAAFHGPDGCLQRKTLTPRGLHKEDASAKLTIDFFFFKQVIL